MSTRNSCKTVLSSMAPLAMSFASLVNGQSLDEEFGPGTIGLTRCIINQADHG